MGKDSGIQWTHHTFNPWWGCEKVSPGCTNCYAWAFDRRLAGGHWGRTAPRRFFGSKHWNEPLKWDAAAARAGERHRVFCASMADVFEDRPVLIEERQRLWDLIHRTPNLDWLLLTKRPEDIAPLLDLVRGPLGLTGLESMERGPVPNVWLGTTVEDVARKGRIDALRPTRAAVRFLSIEPLLEDLGTLDLAGIDWVIVGGESGAQARPFGLDWARSIRDQCQAAGVACFVKQLGARPVNLGVAGDWPIGTRFDLRAGVKLRDSHGGDMAEWPEDLRVREMPAPATEALAR